MLLAQVKRGLKRLGAQLLQGKHLPRRYSRSGAPNKMRCARLEIHCRDKKAQSSQPKRLRQTARLLGN